jgi:hypothetical protein
VFTAGIELSEANQSLLLKLCCLQRISVCCENFFVCSEGVFVAETISLSNSSVCSEVVVNVEVCCLQRISVRCRISIVSHKQVFANKIMQQIMYLKWPGD